MASFLRVALLGLVVASVFVAAHDFTAKERAFQRARTMQTIEELDSVLPHRGRIQRGNGAASVTLTADPGRISDAGTVFITAKFDNWAPTPDDFVTVSCGPTRGLDDFLDAVTLLDEAVANPVRVNFTNLYYMRCDYVFTYVGVTYFPNIKNTALGQLTVPSVDTPGTPKQGHLSYVDDPTKMIVQYVSGLTSPAPSVRFGTDPAHLSTVVPGTSATYKATDMCHDPANQTAQQWFRDPGFIHTVSLTSLTPDTRYYYQYGNDVSGWSAVTSFRAGPGTSRGVRFVAYGDQDIGEASHNTSRFVSYEATQRDLDFVVHFGDLGYALGQAWIWDAWGTIVADGASRVPYMVSVGNHEYDYTGGQQHDPSKEREPGGGSFVPDWWANGPTASRGECGVPMFYRFAAPSNGNSIFWYSFYYGNVFVVQISSEHNFTRGSHQWNWLQQTLAHVDRVRAPWVIVTMHRPMYSTQMCETDDYVISLHMRRALDPLFEQYNVNLALVAHTHSYERTCPLLGGECVEDGRGVVHMTVGSAGAGLETCGYSPALGNFSRSHINTFGYLRAETSDDAINLQFLLDADGSIYDEYTLRRTK